MSNVGFPPIFAPVEPGGHGIPDRQVLRSANKARNDRQGRITVKGAVVSYTLGGVGFLEPDAQNPTEYKVPRVPPYAIRPQRLNGRIF